MASNIRKNYIYNVLYQIISIIVPFITAPYTSRVLGAQAIGDYSFTAANVSYFSIVAGLGLAAYGKRETAYYQNDKKKRSIVFFEVQCYKFVTTCIAVVAFLIFVHWFSPEDRRYLYQIQVISILSVFFDISWFFQGLEDFKITVIRNLFVKLVGTVGVFVFVHRSEDIGLYIALHCLISIVSNILLWPYLSKYIEYPGIKSIKPLRLTGPMLELFIPVIAIQVYNVLDKTLVGKVTKSSYESGYYEQTTKIVSILLTLVTSLGGVLLPRMAAMYTNDETEQFEELATKAFQFVILCAFPLWAGIVSVANRFIPVFLGKGYEKVVELLYVYSLVIVIIPISNIAGDAILTPTGQHNKGTVSVVAGACVNFLLNMVLISRLQSMGAAIATVVAECVVTLMHVYFIRDNVDINKIAKYYFRNFTSACVMGLVVFFVGLVLGNIGLKDVITLIIQIIIGISFYYFWLVKVVKDGMFLEFRELIVNKFFQKRYKAE